MINEPEDLETSTSEPELFTIKLIHNAVEQENPDDQSLSDYTRIVVSQMLR
jgi:hypothetical protein